MSEIKLRDELSNDEKLNRTIAERAYFIAESQGFAPGRDEEFWLIAETEVRASLGNGTANGTNGVTAPVKKAPTKKVAPQAAVVEVAEPAPKPKVTKSAKVAPAAPVVTPPVAEPTATPKKRAPKKSAG